MPCPTADPSAAPTAPRAWLTLPCECACVGDNGSCALDVYPCVGPGAERVGGCASSVPTPAAWAKESAEIVEFDGFEELECSAGSRRESMRSSAGGVVAKDEGRRREGEGEGAEEAVGDTSAS